MPLNVLLQLPGGFYFANGASWTLQPTCGVVPTSPCIGSGAVLPAVGAFTGQLFNRLVTAAPVYKFNGSTWDLLTLVPVSALPTNAAVGTVYNLGAASPGPFASGIYILTAKGPVVVTATSKPSAEAAARGLSLGLVGVGESKAVATTNVLVESFVSGTTSVDSTGLNVLAVMDLPASGTTTGASANGSSGGFVAGDSAITIVSNTSTVKAYVGDGMTLSIPGNIVVAATTHTRQDGLSDNTAGGLVAGGAAKSTVTSNTTTQAFLGLNVDITANSLGVNATSHDDNTAKVTPGAGGLVAGVSARPLVSSTSTTFAGIGNRTLANRDIVLTTGTGGLQVNATHTSTFNARVVASAFGLVSGAGADVDNYVDSVVEAKIGDSVVVDARSIDIAATNIVDQPSFAGGANVKATAGGLISGARAKVDTTITRLQTLVTVGANADLEVKGDASNLSVFVLRALNVINSYNKATFTTGGAASGADTDVVFTAAAPLAKVMVNTGVSLVSPGKLELSARSGGSIDALIGTDTYGIGTVTGGTSRVEIRPDNVVDIAGSTLLSAFGDLNLLAGRSADPSLVDASDRWFITARYDAFAGSAIPISDIEASAWLDIENRISVALGAVLKSARQANMYAAHDPVGSIESKAKATSWVSAASSAVFGLLGGSGEVGYDADTQAEAHGFVTFDGTFFTGLNRHQALTLSGWNRETGVVTASVQSTGVTFTTSFKALTSELLDELVAAQAALAEFGSSNPTLAAFYQGEIDRITDELFALGLLDPNSGNPIPSEQEVLTVTVNPVWAQGGLIDVRTDQFQGGGTLHAPTDTSITIINDTPAFLEIRGATIPELNGGLFLNGTLTTTVGAINTSNGQRASLDNDLGNNDIPNYTAGTATFTLTFGDPTPDPTIRIENIRNVNTINEGNDPETGQPITYPWPDLTVLGPNEGGQGIFNDGGSVVLTTLPSGDGDVVIRGTVRAQNLTVVAGGDVNIVGLTVYEVGGSPASLVSGATTGTYQAGDAQAPGVVTAYDCSGYVGDIDDLLDCLAGHLTDAPLKTALMTAVNTAPLPVPNLYGDRIHIEAEFINVNGIMQSGRDVYHLELDADALDEALDMVADGQRGRLYLIETSEKNPGFAVFYNTATGQFDVDETKVGGGFIELFGHILNSGYGQIKVLGGYGRIEIDNTTSRTVVLNRLDVSQRGKGTIIVADLARGGPSGVSGSTGGLASDGANRATLQTGTAGEHNAILWSARLLGSTQTDIKVALVKPGPSAPLSVSVSGRTITVTLATNAAGNITSTAAQVIAAIQGSTAANNLVTVRNSGTSNGTGVVVASSALKLTMTNPYATIYQWTPGGYTVTTDGGKDSSGANVDVFTGTTATYQPAAGWRYGWTTLVDRDLIKRAEIKRSTWFDFIPLGSSFDSWDSIEVNGTPRYAGSGPYYYVDHTANADAIYTYSTEVKTISSTGIVKLHEDVHKKWWGKRTYHVILQERERQNVLHHHTLNAHRAIGIVFLGFTEGGVDVDSTGSVIVRGPILNPTGVTSIDTDGSITQQGAGSVSGRQIILDAGTGIGSLPTPIRTDVVDTGADPYLRATTVSGGVTITEASGDLLVDQISSANGGDITLVSPAAIRVATTAVEGLVSGGNITMTSKGGIGNSVARPLVINTGVLPAGSGPNPAPRELFATALGNVYIKEKAGDLWLDTLHTSGTVWLWVPTGKLLDANDFVQRDERTYEELKGGIWTDLGLTAGTGAATKIADAITSYKENKEQEYRTYWEYRNVATVELIAGTPQRIVDLLGGALTFDQLIALPSLRIALTQAEIDFYTVFFTEEGIALGKTGASLTTYVSQAIQTLENSLKVRFLNLHTQFTEYFNLPGLAFLGGLDPFTLAPTVLPPLVINPVTALDAVLNTLNLGALHGFHDGDAVRYDSGVFGTGSSNVIGGLVDGTIYYVRLNGTDPDKVTFHPTRNDALNGTNAVDLSPLASSPLSFAPLTALVVDTVAETINLGAPHNLRNGDAVTYNPGLVTLPVLGQVAATALGGLVSGAKYYVHLGAGNKITLHSTLADALSGANPINLSLGLVNGVAHTLTPALGVTHSLVGLFENTLTEVFTYVLTIAEDTKLRENIKVWTEDQLLNLISSSVLKSVTDTQVDEESDNIRATDITLITGSDIGATTGQTTILIDGHTFTEAERVAISAAERADTSFVFGTPINATVTFNGPARTITWVSGTNFSALQPGMFIKISGNTANATDGLAYHKILSVTSTLITLVDEEGVAPNKTIYPDVITETARPVSLLSIVLDPTFAVKTVLEDLPVFFTNNGFGFNGRNGDTITRTDGGSFITDGFVVGSYVRLPLAAFNATIPGRSYQVAAVTASTLTLTGGAVLVTAGTALLPILVDLLRGAAPIVNSIVIDNRDDLDISGSGALNVDSEGAVLLGSEDDVRINRIDAVGFARIKTGANITNVNSPGAVNIASGDLILEAGDGRIGTADTPIRTDLHTGATLTARAFNSVYIYERNPSGTAGDMRVEAILSRAGIVRLEADGSIVDHLGTSNAKIRATRVELDATGGIGEDGDHLEVDVIGSGTLNVVTAVANGDIWLAESDGNLRLRVILSRTGNVNLKAQFSIIDAVDVYNPYDPWNSPDDTAPIASKPRINVIGNSITLIASLGTVGTANNDIDIDSDTTARWDDPATPGVDTNINAGNVVGDGTLSSASDEGNTYVIEPLGDLYLGNVKTTTDVPGLSFIAFVTVPTGRILNGTSSGYNLESGKAWLFASGDIGQELKHIMSKVGKIEGWSTGGSVFITNEGALNVGGVVDGFPTPPPAIPAAPTDPPATPPLGELPDPVEPELPPVIEDVLPDDPGVPELPPLPDVPPLPTPPPPPPVVGNTVGGITSAGKVIINALSPITLSEHIVAGGDVIITSADNTANDNITIRAGARSRPAGRSRSTRATR